MNIVFFISVILKGIGALLEILLQILITRTGSLSIYGTYNTWVSTADLIFWCLFSGIVKCNTYYLSGKSSTLKQFRGKYYRFYVLPVIGMICIIAAFAGKGSVCLVAFIALAEVMVLDRSSMLLAERRYMHSLTGEYILGRLFLLGAVLFLQKCVKLTPEYLITVYLVQYILVCLFFVCCRKKKNRTDISSEVSLKKWRQYQKSDILQSLISQAPVILQYFFSGSLEAGVVSVVLLVKKLINFISGPAAKIFLPEFSRLYHAGRKTEIRKNFASIMRIQMLFTGPLAVVLLGFPRVVLHILAEELLPYTGLFMCCSVVFLVAATLGPCGGLMQMTENEKKDNYCRETAICVMIAVFFVMRRNSLFALYGLCAQTLCESVSKYVFVCRWMEKPPVRLNEYISWWLLPAGTVVAANLFGWQNSAGMMILMAILNFIWQLAGELKDGDALKKILNRRKENG